MTPLNQIPTPALLLRIAQILNVPVQDVFADNIKADQVSGFYLKREGLAVRMVDYIISAEDYHANRQPHSPGQPPADELFTTTAKERAENAQARRKYRWKLAGRIVIGLLLLALLVRAYLKFNHIIP